MKKTRLMRTLSSPNCSKVFSAKLNKAFDEAIENGSSELVDADNDLAIAQVGNDIIVEDKVNNEITKFENNPDVPNDMIMEAIDEETVNMCDKARKYSEIEEPVPTEKYEDTPVVGIKSETHEIETVPEVEVVVNEGVDDNEKSGTIPFSIKFRNVDRNKMFSITKAIKKAFSEEEEVKNDCANLVEEITNAVKNEVEEVVNNAIEEIKTESRKMSRKFCDSGMTQETADAIVNAVVNEVKNVVEEVVNKVNNTPEEVEVTEEVKNESKKFSDEEEMKENIKNVVNEAVNNAIENVKNSEEVEEVENVKNEIKNEVVEDVTDELDQLVNDATIEPQVEVTEEEEEVVNKEESKQFSMTRTSDLDSMLTARF